MTVLASAIGGFLLKLKRLRVIRSVSPTFIIG